MSLRSPRMNKLSLHWRSPCLSRMAASPSLERILGGGKNMRDIRSDLQERVKAAEEEVLSINTEYRKKDRAASNGA